MANDLHRYGIMEHVKGTSYEDDYWFTDNKRFQIREFSHEDMIPARQEIMEIAEDDDIYESLLSGGYFEEDEDLDVWLWGVS